MARAALELEPSAGQKLPPNWCVQTTPKWVPWGCEVFPRPARLKWSLEKAGSSTLPGRLHKLCSGKVLRKLPLQFRAFAPKMDRTAVSMRWLVQSKAKKAESGLKPRWDRVPGGRFASRQAEWPRASPLSTRNINPTAMLLNPLDDTTHPYRARCPRSLSPFPLLLQYKTYSYSFDCHELQP